jgi:hypothetical protein
MRVIDGMEGRDEKGRWTERPAGSGRQKGSTSITAELCKILEKKIVATFPEFAQKPEMAKKKAKEIMAEKMMLDALKGNTMMQMHIHNQVDGKAHQNVNLGGQEDNPIKIEIEHIRPKVENE